MYVVAVVLAVLSALFYAAGQHQLGSVGADVCSYGGLFCDKPIALEPWRAALERDPLTPPPAGCVVDRLRIEKR